MFCATVFEYHIIRDLMGIMGGEKFVENKEDIRKV